VDIEGSSDAYSLPEFKGLLSRQILMGNETWLKNQNREVLRQACLERGIQIGRDRQQLAQALISQVCAPM